MNAGKVLDDLWGQLLRARHAGLDDTHLIVRDDGYTDQDTTEYYFRPFRKWYPCEQKAVTKIHGRSIDVGCGAGRVSLWLQTQGVTVQGLDPSPGALAVASARGVRDLVQGSWQDYEPQEPPSSLVLLGNNLGMPGSLPQVEQMLRRLRSWVPAAGILVFSALDPRHASLQVHDLYFLRNRQAGHYPYEMRLRLRWRGWQSEPFGWVLVDPDTLSALAPRSGWRVGQLWRCHDLPCYSGVLCAE